MTTATGSHVPGLVVGAVLFAALLHASWNALIRSRGDIFLSTVLVAAGGGLLGALALPFVEPPAAASWPFIAASSLTQIVYYALLIETYRGGEMSHAYPLMRGSAPLLVAVANGPLTGEWLSSMQWAALACICGGVLALHGAAHKSATTRRTTLFALMTACVIASYTMIDGAGVRRSGAPAAYTMWIFVLTALGVLGWAARIRPGELAQYARVNLRLALFGGAATLGSYGIALWAMRLA